MSILASITSPADLRDLSSEQLYLLADEVRALLVDTVSETGGHLAPNLGVVELTIGLHLALSLPKDKIVWDVGHQCYTHKLLTGRQDRFATLRTSGGMAGFPKRAESEFDVADTGHSSTSIGIALGMAAARDLQHQDGAVVAVIGDGALTGGPAYEALNHAGHLKTDLIVVLNDNEMSIDSNVGAIAAYLERLRVNPTMRSLKSAIESHVQRIPGIGQRLVQMEEKVMDSLVRLVVPGIFFEELGFKYIGPIDGHSIGAVVRDIRLAKETGGPVLVHCITKKGNGYLPAESSPGKWHGTSPFIIATGEPKRPPSTVSYTEIFGDALVEIADIRPEVVAITAAMASGTGLERFAAAYPERFFDVGIAEGHAVTLASGLAAGGLRPVVAAYSTFLQRGFDQIVQDVSLSELPVVFAVDRAGIVGEDGPTHHGSYDLTYFSAVPGMTVMAPSDEQELRDMLFTSFELSGPCAIRYPRGSGPGAQVKEFSSIEVGRGRVISRDDESTVALIALGRMLDVAKDAAELLRAMGIRVAVVDARFAKPIDSELILSLSASCSVILTLEENTVIGGFGSAVSSLVAAVPSKSDRAIVLNHGLPDRFVEQGPTPELLAKSGLDAAQIAASAETALGSIGSGRHLRAQPASVAGS